MRIGIYAFRQNPYISANTAIAYSIGAEINKTEDVVYIGRKQDDSQNSIIEYNGIRIIYLNSKPINSVKRFNSIFQRFGLYSFALRDDIGSLKTIARKERLDALLCITAPNENAIVSCFANLNVPIYLYQLDPFYNQRDTVDYKQKKLFLKILPLCKHVFTTELLLNEYKKDKELASYLNKFEALQFPKLVQPRIIRQSVNDKPRLLYTGSFYSSIRSPHILTMLRQALTPWFEIVFCGSCDRDKDMEELKNSGVICKGYCAQDVLQQEITDADILINIGNSVRNQLGSKLIDYISTGKPILNVTQIDNCPTEHVLKDYKYKLCLHKDSIVNHRNQIEDFIIASRNKIMPWNEIIAAYGEYTPGYVSMRILREMNKE